MTVGGNRINFPVDCGTPTVDLLTVKLLFKNFLSTTNVKFMTLDIKKMYLNTPTLRYKYIRLKMEYLLGDVIE